MKLDKSMLIILFIVSLFCGIIIVAIGFGAAFPVINRVAAPFACNGKKLELETEAYSYQPGQQTTTIDWFCVDEKTGVKEGASFQVILAAGLIYSLVIFAAFITRWLVVKRPGKNMTPSASMSALPPAAVFSRKNDGPESAWKRLEELKRLRASDLISDQDYEKKKAEILKDV